MIHLKQSSGEPVSSTALLMFRSSVDNLTTVDHQGEPGDGTSVGMEKPFLLSLSCDDDGCILQVKRATLQYFK